MTSSSPIATVGVIVFKQNDPDRVCLMQHREKANHLTGLYGLPAGKIESDEKPIDAAVRELREESGLMATQEHMVFLKQYEADIEQKDGMKHMLWDVYWCQQYSGELQSSDETLSEWVEVKNLASIGQLLPNVADAIMEARKLMLSQK